MQLQALPKIAPTYFRQRIMLQPETANSFIHHHHLLFQGAGQPDSLGPLDSGPLGLHAVMAQSRPRPTGSQDHSTKQGRI
jgi:hypothetical protein